MGWGRRFRELVPWVAGGDELFGLYGVSRDGRRIYYWHGWPLDGRASGVDPLDERDRVVWHVDLSPDNSAQSGSIPPDAVPGPEIKLRSLITPKIAPQWWRPGHLNYDSPDGRYRVRATSDRQGTDCLDLLSVHGGARRFRAAGEQGFLWLPRRPHTLVFALAAPAGPAGLWIWDGGSHPRPLVRARRPQDEFFELWGVSKDGRRVCYRHLRRLGVVSAADQRLADRERQVIHRVDTGSP